MSISSSGNVASSIRESMRDADYSQKKHVRINTSDIIYIDADGHYLKIVTVDGEYKFKEKIKEFKTQLNNNNIIQVLSWCPLTNV